MNSPLPSSTLIKVSDGKTLGHRCRAGGWFTVINPPEWQTKQ